jgi:small conductance mechanosensitive channel
VASLGLVSVGIGFALKDIIENFLAGVILILQRPFIVGDVVCIGDVEGTVEDVRVRDTVIRKFDGRQVFVPNAGIFTKAVTNNNRNRKRRLDFEVNIGFSDDTTAAIQRASQALGGVEGVLADPSPLVVVKGFAEAAVQLKAYFWIDPVDTNLLEAKSAGIAAVKAALAELGIEEYFPVVMVKSAD